MAESNKTGYMVVKLYNELKHKNSILSEKVNTLQESLKELRGKLHEDNKTRVKFFKASERNLASICTFFP